MIVDCSTCTVRGDACSGCVVSLLFGSEPGVDVPWHGPGRAELVGPALHVPARQPDDIDRAIVVLSAAGMLDDADVPLSMTLSLPLANEPRGLRSLGA